MKNRARKQSVGFTLIELMTATALFLVIGGAGFMLVRRHVSLFTSQQNQAGLNIGLRNAVAQIQIDVVNAGSGFYAGAEIPAWPLGVLIDNHTPTSACNDPATHTFGAECFDDFSVLAKDPNTPPSHPTDIGANCVSTTSSNVFLTPTGTTTLAQLAGNFNTGDQVLLVNSTGTQMATAILTAAGQVTGGKVKLQHNPTGDTTSDPFQIVNHVPSNKLGAQFCQDDWVLKISGITYSVDTTDPSNPKLIREINGKNSKVIADQIVGFKVDGMTGTGAGDLYDFDNTDYDPTSIRAIRVSIMGRTPPAGDNLDNDRNKIDGGPYRIQALSVVINPRNLSMKD